MTKAKSAPKAKYDETRIEIAPVVSEHKAGKVYDFKDKSTDADFRKAIDSVHKRAATVQGDLQYILLGLTSRFLYTGDNRPYIKMVNYLIDGMPKGVRSNAIREYMEHYGGLLYSEEAKGFTGAQKASAISLADMQKVKWWDCKPEPEYKGMQFLDMLDKLVKEAVKRDSKPNPLDDIDMDMVRAIQKLRAEKAVINEAAEKAASDA